MRIDPFASLAAADTMLTHSTGTAAGARHRAVAFLLRMALEEGLRRYWNRVCPDLNRCAPHIRSLCLEFYGGVGLSGRWSACWMSLSRACHYHGYGHTPSAVEMRSRHDEVAYILREFSRAVGMPPSAIDHTEPRQRRLR